MLLARGMLDDRKCAIDSNAPVEGEYARIRSNIDVRYQGSIHGLIRTPKIGPIFLAASKPSIGPATSNFMSKHALPIHPKNWIASRCCRGAFWDHPVFKETPEGHDQFARQCDDRNPSNSARCVSDPCVEPSCQVAVWLTAQPKSRPVRWLSYGPGGCLPC